jgi:hypothetical protein
LRIEFLGFGRESVDEILFLVVTAAAGVIADVLLRRVLRLLLII